MSFVVFVFILSSPLGSVWCLVVRALGTIALGSLQFYGGFLKEV